jgi:hypothetical protein
MSSNSSPSRSEIFSPQADRFISRLIGSDRQDLLKGEETTPGGGERHKLVICHTVFLEVLRYLSSKEANKVAM